MCMKISVAMAYYNGGTTDGFDFITTWGKG